MVGVPARGDERRRHARPVGDHRARVRRPRRVVHGDEPVRVRPVVVEPGAGAPRRERPGPRGPARADDRRGRQSGWAYYKPSMFWSASAKTEHPAEVATFLDYLANSEEAADLLLAERGVPANEKIREYITPKLDEVNQTVVGFLDDLAPAGRRRPAGHAPGRRRDRGDHRPAHPEGALRRADARAGRDELPRGAAAGARRRRHLGPLPTVRPPGARHPERLPRLPARQPLTSPPTPRRHRVRARPGVASFPAPSPMEVHSAQPAQAGHDRAGRRVRRRLAGVRVPGAEPQPDGRPGDLGQGPRRDREAELLAEPDGAQPRARAQQHRRPRRPRPREPDVPGGAQGAESRGRPRRLPRARRRHGRTRRRRGGDRRRGPLPVRCARARLAAHARRAARSPARPLGRRSSS